MSDTYTKLFRGITTSTIVGESLATRWLWVTLLAMCDRRGVVYGSVPGLARLANITTDECVDGLNRLMAPDPWSRTKEHEGRRLAEIDGGWLILNHAKYDAMRSAEEVAARKREWDRNNRPSGHARSAGVQSEQSEQSDRSPTQSDASPTQSAKVRCPLTPTPTLSLKAEDQDQEQAAQPAKEPRSRGSRLPQDWQPSPADLDFIARERPDLDPDAVAANFRDWWHSVAGQKGVKADWAATWRTWVRRQDPPRKPPTAPPKGFGISKTGAFLQSLDAAIDQLENGDGEVVSIGNRAGPAVLAGPGA